MPLALRWPTCMSRFIRLTPTDAGSQTSSEATYTSYARVAVARTTGGWTVSGTSPTSLQSGRSDHLPRLHRRLQYHHLLRYRLALLRCRYAVLFGHSYAKHQRVEWRYPAVDYGEHHHRGLSFELRRARCLLFNPLRRARAPSRCPLALHRLTYSLSLAVALVVRCP
jgi:hypothetical protein